MTAATPVISLTVGGPRSDSAQRLIIDGRYCLPSNGQRIMRRVEFSETNERGLP